MQCWTSPLMQWTAWTTLSGIQLWFFSTQTPSRVWRTWGHVSALSLGKVPESSMIGPSNYGKITTTSSRVSLVQRREEYKWVIHMELTRNGLIGRAFTKGETHFTGSWQLCQSPYKSLFSTDHHISIPRAFYSMNSSWQRMWGSLRSFVVAEQVDICVFKLSWKLGYITNILTLLCKTG